MYVCNDINIVWKNFPIIFERPYNLSLLFHQNLIIDNYIYKV